MICALGVTRTPTTLLGGSAVGAGKVEGSGGGSVEGSVEGSVVGSVVGSDGGWVGESVDLVMTVLAAMEVVGSMPVTSSAQLFLVGPVHERNQQISIV